MQHLESILPSADLWVVFWLFIAVSIIRFVLRTEVLEQVLSDDVSVLANWM